MARTLACLAILIPTIYAQTFEVASIKPTAAELLNGPSGITTGHGRITARNATLKRCIMGAYGLGPHQIAGGPPWLDSDRFEIVAKAEQPVNDDGALMLMLRSLLEERFKLRIHRESRMLTALVLEVSKAGPKLEKAEEGSGSTSSGRGTIDAKATTMLHFADVLSRQMELPVIDHTELKGWYNVKVSWRPENVKPADDAMERPSIFAALQALGLRLESRKVPIEVLVIDAAEKPTEN